MRDNITQIEEGIRTAFVDSNYNSNLAYRPQFVSNNYKEGKKVLSSIEDELLNCDKFQISVAFITMGGITPLLQTLRSLALRGIPGQILTTNYLNFSEPSALEKIHSLQKINSKIELRMYDVDAAGAGFHTKGYIFKDKEIYRIIVGSSNITRDALTSNHEWNTRVVSTEHGEYAQQIVDEFNSLWNSEYALKYDDFIENYREKYLIIKHQREAAKQDEITSLEKYKLIPNSMQVGFICNLKNILASGEERALLISATGTGKTYASAFAMRELGFKRVLFLVHRGQLARQTKRSYERVFNKSVSMGIVGAGYLEYDKDYVFATVQTLCREEHLQHYKPNDFDCIVVDEAHHVPADTFQTLMRFFKPKFWLGMTATPDKRDDHIAGRNVYEIFHYQIAYEIRLQKAMEDDLLCPFHYFGISDLDQIGIPSKKSLDSRLICDDRVRHIIEQADYYGYSGDRVKGLVFCSGIDESERLSERFNQEINPSTGKLYRTRALNGSASEEERAEAFERLAMDEADATEQMQPLDYIFSVEILNEGVDIVEVNQVIMLRPTESPIVFIQQLGRGLRKAEGKEYVVILDFIGNYNNNFMIPVALSGDRTYNPDVIRKYVISGNSTIPGASTVHFDEVSREKIFSSIDHIKKLPDIIKDSYISLKNRLGRVPYLRDFYENGEIDPLVIIEKYRTYQCFLEHVEEEFHFEKLDAKEKLILEYLSSVVLQGARPHELLILKRMLDDNVVSEGQIRDDALARYGYELSYSSLSDAAKTLQGYFVKTDAEYQKYKQIDILRVDKAGILRRLDEYANRLNHVEFRRQVEDLISVGISKFDEKYANGASDNSKFVLFEKYSRRDVCLLMNYGKDISGTMFGMRRFGDDVFLFVTYHKQGNEQAQTFVAGKPLYPDAFVDNVIFEWCSKLGTGLESSYVQQVLTTKRKHLLIKKSDAESNLYYMGQFDVIGVPTEKMMHEKGKDQIVCLLTLKMHHAVRDDLLRYLKSNLQEDVIK